MFVNSKLQERYMTVPLAWTLIQQLKNEFEHHLTSLSSGNFAQFSYLRQFKDDHLCSFQQIIRKFLQNMDIRFPCPSFSIKKKLAARNTNQTTLRLHQPFLQTIWLDCPLFEVVGLFIFPNDLIKKHQINPRFVGGKYPEIPHISREMLQRVDEIKNVISRERKEESNSSIITLLDVFQILPRNRYPFLWHVTIRVLSFMPTSASCEQSFSCLRRRLHENMAKTTVFNFLLTCQNDPSFHF